eukprot:6478985-Lingulodinium_polyedra.AAC.1
MGFVFAERCVSGDVLGMRALVVSCSSNEGFQGWVQLASKLPEDPVVAAAAVKLKEHHKSEAELRVKRGLLACSRGLCAPCFATPYSNVLQRASEPAFVRLRFRSIAG